MPKPKSQTPKNTRSPSETPQKYDKHPYPQKYYWEFPSPPGSVSCEFITQAQSAPLTHFNDEEGGGGPSNIFGSEILAKSDFFRSMKDAGIFFGSQKKKQRDFIWVTKKGPRDLFGYAKKVVIFLGRQILKL